MSNLKAIRLQKFRFKLRCETAMQFNEFIGNDLRSAFGFMLRQSACQRLKLKDSSCVAECREPEHCLYSSLFASRNSSGQQVARPYLLEPLFTRRTHYEAGQRFVFNLTLIGDAVESLNECVEVFRRLGQCGLGHDYRHGQGRFEVESVEAEAADGSFAPIYPDPAYQEHQEGNATLRSAWPLDGATLTARTDGLVPRQIALQFLTPLHLRDAKPPRHARRDIEFHHLWDNLQHRLEHLMLQHCGEHYQSEFGALKKQAAMVRKVEDSLRWQSQERRTSAHQTVDMGGLLGHVVFEGEMTSFLPVLALGEWLHLGHGCDLGNGRYRLLLDFKARSSQ